MKNLFIGLSLATTAMIHFTSSSLAEPAGLQQLYIDMPHHNAPAAVSVWYPNKSDGPSKLHAENPVFKGVEAVMDAPVAEGQFPIVLFSHGMGGTSRAQAWLASALAKRGALVISLNHPNTTWGDFNMQKGVKHWTRALDISSALDSISQNSKFKDHIDESRIMAAGFSYGGWTALSLGGMTSNHAGFVSACQTDQKMAACELLLSEKVNMQGQDADIWNASYKDERVTHVAAIDPGFVWGLNEQNTKDLVENVTLIGFGDDATRMSATNFKASGLSKLLPNAEIKQFVPGFHFTAMPLCKPEAEAILKSEKDDPVCTDPKGTNREAVHMQIIDIITKKIGL
ncbi:MAG: alpha/beta hydrolase family protein [Nitratireductor sp.]